jgi:hypothetical protein
MIGDNLLEIVAKIKSDARSDLEGIFEDTCDNHVKEILALLPSLKGWVKVGYLGCFHNDARDGEHYECKCNGKGEIVSPLKFEDVDWKLALDIALYQCPDTFTTKTGEVIRREG